MPHPTFSEARRALRADETSCEALVSSFLERIDEKNERLNAFLEVDREGALGYARHLDSRRRKGESGPLTGLVLAVKDTIAIRGEPLTCGSKMLEGFTSLFDATAVKRLREAGAVFIGKTNCDEFAMGSSNETSHFGPVQHPMSAEHVPGGSSGGSAAAVAAGLCHAALGSDTGGSVRQPSAFCGAVGLRPTYGRVSRHGLVAHASSFDVIGPMTRSVEDAARLLGVMAGEDAYDATSAPVEVPDYLRALGEAPGDVLAGLRVGVPKEYFAEKIDDGVRERLRAQGKRLAEAGAEVTKVSLPHAGHGLAAYYVLATAEASSNLARYDGLRYGHRAEASSGENGHREKAATGALEEHYTRSRTEGFGAEVKRRLMLGAHVLSAGYHDRYYEQAQRVRTLIRDDFDRALEELDVLLTPTTPTPAFRRDTKAGDPLGMYRSDVFTVGASLAGLPALSVPVESHPEAPHLPVGAQLIGRPFDEALLLQVGEAVVRVES